MDEVQGRESMNQADLEILSQFSCVIETCTYGFDRKESSARVTPTCIKRYLIIVVVLVPYAQVGNLCTIRLDD